MIKKVSTDQGTRWEVDYRDPQGHRLRRRFERKKDAELLEATAKAAKHSGKYDDIFGTAPKNSHTFRQAMEIYVENFQGQKSYSRWKRVW